MHNCLVKQCSGSTPVPLFGVDITAASKMENSGTDVSLSGNVSTLAVAPHAHSRMAYAQATFACVVVFIVSRIVNYIKYRRVRISHRHA